MENETIEVRKSCMICSNMQEGGYYPTCKVRKEGDILTVPFKRCCELFKLNPKYEVE